MLGKVPTYMETQNASWDTSVNGNDRVLGKMVVLQSAL